MSQFAVAQGQHAQTLNTQFGDAPLGRLGNKPVSAEQPGSPRTPLGKIANAVKSLGQHIVKSLAPASARANTEVRHATREFSAHLGDALGGLQALGKTPRPENKSTPDDAQGKDGPDGPKAEPSAEELQAKAQLDAKALKTAKATHDTQYAKATVESLSRVLIDAKALAQHGIGLQEALDARIDLHLQKLSHDELVDLLRGCTSESGMALMKQMANERRDGVSQALHTILRKAGELLQTQVQQQIASGVDASLAKSLQVVDVAKEATGRDEFANRFGTVSGAPSLGMGALYNSGVLPKPSGKVQAQVIDGHVKEGLGRMEGADLQRLLTRVSSADLKALLQARSPNGVDLAAVDAALQREVNARTERLTLAVGQAQHAVAEGLAEADRGLSASGGQAVVNAIVKGASAMTELVAMPTSTICRPA